MLHYERQLPSFGAFSASATRSILVPTGPTYKAFVFEPTIAGVAATIAQMRAQIELVKFKINGRPVYELSADAILDLNAFYGFPVEDGALFVPLTFDWVRTVPAMENLAWGTRNVDSLAIDIKLAAGATIDAIVGNALMVPEARDLGLILEAHTFTFATTGAGLFEISTLPKGNGDLFACHFETAVANKLELKLNGVSFRDGTDFVAKVLAKHYGERVPQTGYLHFDPTAYGLMVDDRIPLGNFVQDFRFILTATGAGTVLAHMLTINQPLAPLSR
jgi:hypothetical protein